MSRRWRPLPYQRTIVALDIERSTSRPDLVKAELRQIRRLATRRAGDPDLAQNALLAAVDAVARVSDLARIENLTAYFCQVLINGCTRWSTNRCCTGWPN